MKASHPGCTYRFLHRHGAQVWLDPNGENLIRAAPKGSAYRWQLCVQGWPNLVHELAHVLQSGKLDEDSGFEYHLVPLDLHSPRGRRYLWDELCACALSCAWGGRSEDRAWVRAWFQEQVDILPVFFGDEADPARFLAKVQACIHGHGQELARAQARLWALAHELDVCDSPNRALALRFPGLSTARDDAALRELSTEFVGRWAHENALGPFRVADLWRDYVSSR